MKPYRLASRNLRTSNTQPHSATAREGGGTEREDNMNELLIKILEFCVANNCGFEYNPMGEVEVSVKGLTSEWKSVTVTLELFNDYVDEVTLYRRDEDDKAEFLHDIPCSDVITFLADVVARYQL